MTTANNTMNNTTDILNLSVVELRDAVAAGAVSAQQAVRAYLDTIATRDGGVGAYLEVFVERSLERAAAVDAARAAGKPLGTLAGVPLAVADNLCTEFGHTTCASKSLANFRSPYSATAVAKWEAAGAIVLGKTNLDEFGMGSSTESSHVKPTRNPWDVSRVPGGACGGSAAAVAGRMAAAALGGDTGGSVRQPAAFCGLVGLKPTYGRVSRFGLTEHGSSLDQVGPMTRDVADAALLLSVMAGHDANDATSAPRPVDDYLAALDQPLPGLRVGLPREFLDQARDAGVLDAEIHAALQQASDAYQAAGATLVDISLPHSRIEKSADGGLASYAVAAYYIIAMAEASSNLARFDGMHFGHRTDKPCRDIHELYSKNRAEGFGDEVKRRIILGTYLLTGDLYDAYFTKALQTRRLITNDFDRAFANCDVLLCPTTPTTPFAFGEHATPLAMYQQDLFTVSASLAGLPCVSIPAGLARAGLPIGMQLVAPAFGESMLLRAARMVEKLVPFTPPSSAWPSGPR